MQQLALPCCAVTPVYKSCRLYPGYHAASIGLQPQHLSGLPCNSSFLIPYCNYRDFNQRFIRIHLLHTHQSSLEVKELYLNAQHQLITSPAPSGGLLTLSVKVSERPSLSLQYLRRAHTKVLLQVGLYVEAIGCKSLSAAVSADEQSQAKILTFNF